uniref:Uncharacterized protein n=1 Tax=Triticum urartu TaxID=4572 RepID=A0A8R7UVK1_TRIUA
MSQHHPHQRTEAIFDESYMFGLHPPPAGSMAGQPGHSHKKSSVT